MKDSPHKFNLLVLDGILPVLPFRSICSEFSTSSSSRKLTTVFMISACLEQVKLEGECAGRAKSTGRDEGSFQPLNTRSHNVVFLVPKGTNQPLLQDLPPSPLHAFQSSLQGWPCKANEVKSLDPSFPTKATVFIFPSFQERGKECRGGSFGFLLKP